MNVGLLQANGLDVDALVSRARGALQSTAESTVDSLYPVEEWMVSIPLMVGVIAAVIAAASLAITYIPSVTSTTLKLRTGVIPSLRDVECNQYQNSADQVTIITGSLVWGGLLPCLSFGWGARWWRCLLFLVASNRSRHPTNCGNSSWNCRCCFDKNHHGVNVSCRVL